MKNKILIWLRDNWILVLIVIVLLVLLRSKGTDNKQAKREIKALNDSIEQLDKQFLWMQDQAQSSMEIAREALNTANLYRDSLNQSKTKIRINNIRHENEIANLKRIPTDSLYVDFTTWLDTLSFD